MNIESTIAREIAARPEQVVATIGLMDDGATVPFIARYRKEATGGLDDNQLRQLETRLRYLRELEDRRARILETIDEQGVLTPELQKAIAAADTKTRLEDLYLPFKPRRRTRAQIAREAGLELLADCLLDDPGKQPEAEAAGYLHAEAGFADVDAVLEGARQILMERFAEDPAVVGELRDYLWQHGHIRSRVEEKKRQTGSKFSDYFDHQERLRKAPSHRTLALFRARNEGVVQLDLILPNAEPGLAHPCVERLCGRFGLADQGRPSDWFLLESAVRAWRDKLSLHLTLDLFGRAREAAEDEAIRVFSENMRDILLAPPAGARVTLGLDPGLRTGVKAAVVDATGKLLATATLYPHPPQKQWDESIDALAALCRQCKVGLVAIGNGTASRETDQWVAETLRRHPELKLEKLMVSEAGASVYSASELAAREFPELDVSLRGAVSIARRLQDPLAELVKIDPKAIGVGQYQHDVNQVKLARALDARVEDCVNAVGVELNTASVPLLSRVAGLNASVAENIVRYREEQGGFTTRQALLAVPRLGPKAFEQSAGFLRIKEGENPLDASGVHPESYPVVQRLLERVAAPLESVMGDEQTLRAVPAEELSDDQFGVPTVTDILRELEKPGRDPRGEFRTAQFAEGVESLADLKPGQVLEGVVSNVTNFGAFVDIGVHQDGLVHISQLADRYVEDPRAVVKAGDIVRVRVQDVDVERKRIGLSMRLEGPKGGGRKKKGGKKRPGPNKAKRPAAKQAQAPQGALADALSAALKGEKQK